MMTKLRLHSKPNSILTTSQIKPLTNCSGRAFYSKNPEGEWEGTSRPARKFLSAVLSGFNLATLLAEKIAPIHGVLGVRSQRAEGKRNIELDWIDLRE